MPTLIKSISYLIADPDTVLTDTDLLIEDGKIAAVGQLDAADGTTVVDASGCVVFPGLINAHTHLWQVTLMGRRDDLPLRGWIDEVLTPAIERLYSIEDEPKRERLSYLWTALGICRMLRSGTTAFLDMDLSLCQEGLYRAAKDAGVRGFFGVELADWFMDGNGNPDAEEALRLLEKYPGAAVLTPTELNYCLDSTLRLVAETARKSGCLVQMHVDETTAEAAQSFAERGNTELLYLDGFGLLNERFSAVHGVHLTEEEIALAARRHVSVVYNPKSNMKLGSGVCPIPKLKEAGLNVALATDGPASNDRLDMLEEMRAGVLLQKVSCGDPKAVLARDVFEMATLGGARLLGLNAGSLKEGMDADLCVMPLNKGNLITNGSDMVSTLVYCAESGDVRDVYVGGKPVLADYRPCAFDEEALVRELAELLEWR